VEGVLGFWPLVALAVALAMDAFAVAVAAGMSLRLVTGRQTFRLAWHFGLFQALMPIAGWGAGRAVCGVFVRVNHWAAFALLAFVGGKMIYGALRPGGQAEPADPTRGWSLVLLSLATSMDALAVGFSLSLLRVNIWWPSLVIGAVCAAFTAAGIQAGRIVGASTRLGNRAELAGGLVLMAIGVKVLVDAL
jgi:putative Mn2+ efflux pump MntP